MTKEWRLSPPDQVKRGREPMYEAGRGEELKGVSWQNRGCEGYMSPSQTAAPPASRLTREPTRGASQMKFCKVQSTRVSLVGRLNPNGNGQSPH